MPNPSISELAASVNAAQARCGGTRVVLIDGPAGSGKSTLTNRLATALGGTASGGAGSFVPDAALPSGAPVQVVHGDDMYEGWIGLATLRDVLLDQVLEPLAAGGDGAFRMWDWVEERRTHRIPVPQRDYLLIEGVGVGLARARELASLVIWVEAPWDERLRRGVERDGEAMREEWEQWQRAEAPILADAGTRGAADVIIDGTSPVPD